VKWSENYQIIKKKVAVKWSEVKWSEMKW
jgi:hypothetical protein